MLTKDIYTYDYSDNPTSSATHYFTTDEQGSIRNVINSDGSTATKLNYDAFGNLVNGLDGYTVHNTGDTNASTDPNWTVTDGNGTRAASVVTPDPAWTVRPGDAELNDHVKWISQSSNLSGGGATYTTSITLPAGATSISGMAAVDDSITDIYVNGTDTHISLYNSNDLFAWHAFTLTGLNANAANTIQFVVSNSGGLTTGIAVQWGTMTSNAPSLLPRFTYTAQQYNSFTNTYFMGNGTRVYNPVTGTFLQEDPAREGTNLHDYVGNDSVNKTDKTGLSATFNGQNSAGAWLGNSSDTTARLLGMGSPLDTYVAPAIASAPSPISGYLSIAGAALSGLGEGAYAIASGVKNGITSAVSTGFDAVNAGIVYASGGNYRLYCQHDAPTSGYFANAGKDINSSAYQQRVSEFRTNVFENAYTFGMADQGKAGIDRYYGLIDDEQFSSRVAVPAVMQLAPILGRPIGVDIPYAKRFSDTIEAQYREAVNAATAKVFVEYNAGNLRVPEGVSAKTIIGQAIDARARITLLDSLQRQGIPEGAGTDILVNRRLSDPSGSGRYRVPDVRLPRDPLILDGTIGKSMLSDQVQDFTNFSGGPTRLIYPTVPLPRIN